MSTSFISVTASSPNAFDRRARPHGLTAREHEIAQLIMQGCLYKDIARRLFISEKTVAKHAQNMYRKLQVSSKVGLVTKLFDYTAPSDTKGTSNSTRTP